MEIKPVPEYEEYYKIASSGQVYSKTKTMALTDNGTGYLQVGLSKNRQRKRFYIHRLVWTTFKGKIPEGYEIHHLDNDKSNNDISNLALVTRAENMEFCREAHPHVVKNLVQYKGL